MEEKIYNLLNKQNDGSEKGLKDLSKRILALFDVSGISTDLEKDLFVLINKHSKAGLSKPHTVARLEWVLGSVKKS